MKFVYCLLLVLTPAALLAATPPFLLLAKNYQQDIDIRQYWVSEKLDGVRALWDGRKFISRGGHTIHAPKWFIKGFPDVTLDGELWAGRGQFAKTLSTVSKDKPIDNEWKAVTFNVFELPHAEGSFSQRLQQIKIIINKKPTPYLRVIPQFRVENTRELMTKLKAVETKGGEGLMLHHQDALYKTGRSQALLKLKSYQDAEATVIGYKAGKGKYQNMAGALKVKNRQGQVFSLGSGLTDALRKNPPAIGSTVTYRYNGLTATGLPRFARFVRVYQAF